MIHIVTRTIEQLIRAKVKAKVHTTYFENADQLLIEISSKTVEYRFIIKDLTDLVCEGYSLSTISKQVVDNYRKYINSIFFK